MLEHTLIIRRARAADPLAERTSLARAVATCSLFLACLFDTLGLRPLVHIGVADAQASRI